MPLSQARRTELAIEAQTATIVNWLKRIEARLGGIEKRLARTIDAAASATHTEQTTEKPKRIRRQKGETK